LTSEWTVAGATIQVGQNEAQVTVKMPDQARVTITLNLRVTLPDGGITTGTVSFDTLTQQAAQFMRDRCELLRMHLVNRLPWLFDPNISDPGPEGKVKVAPGELAALRGGLANMLSAVDNALQAGGGLIIGPSISTQTYNHGISALSRPHQGKIRVLRTLRGLRSHMSAAGLHISLSGPVQRPES
jgi:hypothetical protein